MKQLPDEKILLELLSLAQETEQKAKELCDLTAEVDEKWRDCLKSPTKKPSIHSNTYKRFLCLEAVIFNCVPKHSFDTFKPLLSKSL